MLTNDQMSILLLLRRAFGLSGESYETEDESELLETVMRSGLLLTVYPVLSAKEQEPFKASYAAALKQSILQTYEGENILNALSDAGFDCIALKGWELQKLYPRSNMRQMADLDILVRPYEYRRIKAIMEKLGFWAYSESSWKHDNFKKGKVFVEMHKRLTDDSAEIRKWEQEMWDRAVRIRGNIFRMTPEDYYLFHFIHMEKDFVIASLGLRRIVDTWLLQKQPIAMELVKAELERFGLTLFHERMVHLSRAVMGEEPMDENCEVLLAHAFKYGIYGSDESHKAGRITFMGKNLKNGKFRSAISAVFLPVARMKAHFPILEKWPVLLPWCWLKRIVRTVLKEGKQIRTKLNYSNIREEEYRETNRFFEAGGIEQK